MKVQKFLVMVPALLLAGMSGAWAHGGRVGVGVYVGPGWGPWWYPPPYYYSYSPPPVVVVPPAQPAVYVEQPQVVAAPAPAAEGQQYWYYCRSAKGYYPYVKECPGGWQKVLPQPEK